MFWKKVVTAAIEGMIIAGFLIASAFWLPKLQVVSNSVWPIILISAGVGILTSVGLAIIRPQR